MSFGEIALLLVSTLAVLGFFFHWLWTLGEKTTPGAVTESFSGVIDRVGVFVSGGDFSSGELVLLLVGESTPRRIHQAHFLFALSQPGDLVVYEKREHVAAVFKNKTLEARLKQTTTPSKTEPIVQ